MLLDSSKTMSFELLEVDDISDLLGLYKEKINIE